MVADAELRRYLARVARVAGDAAPAAVLGAVAGAVAGVHGVDLAGTEGVLQPTGAVDAAALVPPAHLAVPELLGQVYESLRTPDARKADGAFYTPETVARPVVAAVLDGLADRHDGVRVADPSAGGGAFLLAAARHLTARGGDPRAIVHAGLYGADVDPTAVAVTRTALAIYAGGQPPAEGHVRVADALLDARAVPSGLDAVVGNPPFQSQLAAATARTAMQRDALAARFGAPARGYADTANLFLILALRHVRPGGRVGLVLSESFIGTRDAGPARDAAAALSALEWLWLAGEPVFAAGVRVCAPVFAVGAPQRAVTRRVGAGFAERAPLPVTRAELRAWPSWAGVVADLLHVPALDCRGVGTLGDHCRATADFRDQYYGLVPAVFDEDDERTDERRFPRLTTVGLIDPGRSLWGVRTARFAKRAYARPRVDLARLRTDGRMGAWATARQVPKVLLATQTRVLEAVVDEAGHWLPSTPTITLEASADRLWHVAAALNSPPLSALAVRRHAGAALSTDAIKLSAADAAALPAPGSGADWDAGAAALRAASAATCEPAWRDALESAGRSLCRAYDLENTDALVEWWLGRVPRWRGPAPATPAGSRSVELHHGA